MTFKRITLFGCALLIGLSYLSATHLCTFKLSAKFLKKEANGKNAYQITLVAYRDASASTISFDDEIDIGVYRPANNTLIKVLTLNKGQESNLTLPFQQMFSVQTAFKKMEYSGIIELAPSNEDFILNYQRCCIPTNLNYLDDQGMELRLTVPHDLQPGESTPDVVGERVINLAKGQPLYLKDIWMHDAFDSIRIDSSVMLLGGSPQNPMPVPTNTLAAKQEGIFRSGYGISQPFGAGGTLQFNGTEEVVLEAQQQGSYILALNMETYRNGVRRDYRQLFYLVCFQTPPGPQLFLELSGLQGNRADFQSHTYGLQPQDSLKLERKEKNAASFSEQQNGLTHGGYVSLSDSGLTLGKAYEYRLSVKDNSGTYYSNVVEVNLTGTEIPLRNTRKMTVYPNPTKDWLIIDHPYPATITLYDNTGKTVRKLELSEGINRILLNGLKPGLYWIQSPTETEKVILLP